MRSNEGVLCISREGVKGILIGRVKNVEKRNFPTVARPIYETAVLPGGKRSRKAWITFYHGRVVAIVRKVNETLLVLERVSGIPRVSSANLFQ